MAFFSVFSDFYALSDFSDFLAFAPVAVPHAKTNNSADAPSTAGQTLDANARSISLSWLTWRQ